jgi:hypothetical protein
MFAFGLYDARHRADPPVRNLRAVFQGWLNCATSQGALRLAEARAHRDTFPRLLDLDFVWCDPGPTLAGLVACPLFGSSVVVALLAAPPTSGFGICASDRGTPKPSTTSLRYEKARRT